MRVHQDSVFLPWEREQQKLTDLDITDEYFQNKYGCIRWKYIRGAYNNGFIDKERVVDLCRKWRDTRENLWLDGFDIEGKRIISCFVKSCKRGNDVYKSRLKQKFSFLEKLDPIYFFGEWGVKSTPMLFVTCTVDPKKYTLDEAWKLISVELHLFEAKLYQEYGSFVKFRVWEAHESGYPHYHACYYFHDTWFHVFEHKEKYRIANKHREKISGFWSMGNVDIQGIQDTHGAFSEVKKYITKSIWNEKGDLTNAMICLHRKRMYSISLCDPFDQELMNDVYNRDLIQQGVVFYKRDSKGLEVPVEESIKHDIVGSIWGMDMYLSFYRNSIDLAEPNNTDLVRDVVHNCNKEYPDVVVWRFVGIVLHDDLRLFMPDLSDSWVLFGDPPPELEGYLGLLCRLDSLELDDEEGFNGW